MSDLIDRQAAIDAMCSACWDWCDEGVCKRVSALQQLPSAQPERTEYIPDTKAVPSKRDCVDLAERVTATFYDQGYEEWTQQSVTIADVLDSVCDDYTILPSAQPEIIRCKECRWGIEACGNIECFADTNVPPEYHGYDWFCPNAERRTDEQTD